MNICPSQESCVIPSSSSRKPRSVFKTEKELVNYLSRYLASYYKFEKIEIYPFYPSAGIGMQIRIITEKKLHNERIIISHKNRMYEPYKIKCIANHLLYDLNILAMDIFSDDLFNPCEAKFTLDFFYFGVCDLCASDLTPRLL